MRCHIIGCFRNAQQSLRAYKSRRIASLPSTWNPVSSTFHTFSSQHSHQLPSRWTPNPEQSRSTRLWYVLPTASPREGGLKETQYENSDDNYASSGYDTSTASLTSSINTYLNENGRRYHQYYGADKNLQPNDEVTFLLPARVEVERWLMVLYRADRARSVMLPAVP